MRPSGGLHGLEERHLRGRRKALLFSVLAILWVFPSIGAVWILWINLPVWSEASTALAALKRTRLEQWVALGLLATHAVFVFLAIHFARHEPRLGQNEDAIEPLSGEGPGVSG
jgi:hypothetical protein